MGKTEGNGGSGKLIGVAILLVIFAIAVLQNTQPVGLKFLFWSASIPRAILILIAALVGLVLGLLFSTVSKKNRTAK